MAARWLPNVEDFFEGFLRLLETSENNLQSATYDNSEFLFRPLHAHERTLSTLLDRIEQTYHGVRVEGKEFSSLSDSEQDDVIGKILSVTPGAGLRMVQGAVRQRRLVVQRDRIHESLRRVDPVTT